MGKVGKAAEAAGAIVCVECFAFGGGAEVPACVSCHGSDAKGAEAFPRLAGQLHDYLFRKLVNWSKERGQDKAKPDNSAIMEPIAHNLTETQVKAIAAYLSYLE